MQIHVSSLRHWCFFASFFLASFAFGSNGCSCTSCLAVWKQLELSAIIIHLVARFSIDSRIYLLTRLLCLLRKCPFTFIQWSGRWQLVLLVMWLFSYSTERKKKFQGTVYQRDHSSCTFDNISEKIWVILQTFGLEVLMFLLVHESIFETWQTGHNGRDFLGFHSLLLCSTACR